MDANTPEQMIAEMSEKLRTRTGKKHEAQAMIMDGIGNVLGYWTERDPMTVQALGGEDSEAFEEFAQILLREADRVAKLLGFVEAWSN